MPEKERARKKERERERERERKKEKEREKETEREEDNWCECVYFVVCSSVLQSCVAVRTPGLPSDRGLTADVRAYNAHVSCVYPVLMSCCDVRAWGVAIESDRVNQRTNVQEGARKRERESARERKRESESKYA